MSYPVRLLTALSGRAYQAWTHVSPSVYHQINDYARVKTYEYDDVTFVKKSYASDVIKWSKSTKLTWADARKRIHYLTDHPEDLAAICEYLVDTPPDAELLKTFGKFGRTDYVRMPGHTYFNQSGRRKVAKEFQAAFADLNNWWPLRAQLSFFPGGGGEVPDEAGRSKIEDPSMLDEALGVEARSQREKILEIVRHYRGQLVDSRPMEGLVQLGRAQVRASRGGTIGNNRFVARYALMSTTPWHVLDGDALWVQLYDLVTNEVMFFVLGAGSNVQQFVDDLNNPVCGLVFGTMLHGFGTGMDLVANKKTQKALMYGTDVVNSPFEVLLAGADSDLGDARKFARFLDLGVPVGATARLTLGMNVSGPPPIGKGALDE